MSRLLYRMGRTIAGRPWPAISVWLMIAVAVVATSGMAGRKLEDTLAVPGLDSQEAVDLLSAAEADEAGLTTQVVFTPRDPSATFFDSPEVRDRLADAEASLAALDSVLGVGLVSASLVEGSDSAVAAGLVSADGRVALVMAQHRVLEALDVEDLDEMKAFARTFDDDPLLRVEMGGELHFALEEPETGPGEIIGLVAALVILVVAFGSLLAAGLPVGLALFGLAVGVSSLSLVAYLIEIPSWAPIFASMIGLGVGIDYALFLVTRHREFLAAGLDVAEAAGRAVATAGQAVVFAGGTVVVSILGLAVAGIPWVTAAGVGISVVVLIMVAASITLLPAFLGLAGDRIDKVGLPGRRHLASAATPQRWTRWGRHVSRHAGRYTVGAVLLLLALTAPVLSLRLGLPDAGNFPESRTERRAYDLLADSFGPGTNGPLVIAVDISQDPSVVEPLRAAIVADPGVVAVAEAIVDDQAGVATIVAVPNTSPQDDATAATVKRLRAEVFPPILGDGGARAHVGGQTASMVDLGGRVEDRLFWFIGAVVLLSLPLLMMVFRSVLVPIKAALLNLLSIGAAYGVVVIVFQWEWGAGLIGVEEAVPVVSFIPMFMFAIVFGLSMDYEVFLLSRVREHYLATGDNEASVIRGLAGTARVISSAALIMVSVFLGFVLSEDPTTKMMGLGLATAIFVDATVVRMLLVPASMKLLGEANWWLPGWLDRLLPAIDIDRAPSPLGQQGPVPARVGEGVGEGVGAGVG